MKWVKFFIGILLLPFLVAQILTTVDLIALWIPSAPWQSYWFWSGLAGVVSWTIFFFYLPRPLWLYVLGHEFTHALAVYLTGGKVFRFHVATEGGHITSDKSAWWISLSPYFVPLYTLIWMALWWSIDFYYPLHSYLALFFFGIGATYAFHLTFTFSMLHPGQTDLREEGYIFSSVVICIANLLLPLLFFFLTSHAVSWREGISLFKAQLVSCYGGMINLISYLVVKVWGLVGKKS